MRGEVQLKGGRVTEGVVRVGDTVRRPCGPHSPFVHELLRHLEAVSFPYAPRFLGIDSEQREILSYIDGQVPANLGWYSDSQVHAAAEIVRIFHEATAGTSLSGEQQVVCHGDLSPCNFVFQSNAPICLIDFDGAFPGPRRIDIGYAVWLWLDIGNPELDPYETGQRIAVFLEGYGPEAPADPIRAITDSQEWLLDRNVKAGGSYSIKVAEWARRCWQWTRERRVVLETALRAGAA